MIIARPDILVTGQILINQTAVKVTIARRIALLQYRVPLEPIQITPMQQVTVLVNLVQGILIVLKGQVHVHHVQIQKTAKPVKKQQESA